MPLDGIFLRGVREETERRLKGARLDKIYEPSENELVLFFRSKEAGTEKLLICTGAENAGLYISDESFENPSAPPRFCLLLRKRLCGAFLSGIRQAGSDRVLFLDFSTVNTLGDREEISLAAELMSARSNLILIDENGIITAVKKRQKLNAGAEQGERQLLPGLKYSLPSSFGKLDIFAADTEETARLLGERLKDCEKPLSVLLFENIEGLSKQNAKAVCEDPAPAEGLPYILEELKRQASDRNFYLIRNEDGEPLDFSFFKPSRPEPGLDYELFRESGRLLCSFYKDRNSALRGSSLSAGIRRSLISAEEKIKRKLLLQREELSQCADRERLRICAELINANLYRIKGGEKLLRLENYYDNNRLIEIETEPSLSPARNAQKYFREYKKTYTREKKLREQIGEGEAELEYIESVFDLLSRAVGESEVEAIRQELSAQGYLKAGRKNRGGAGKQRRQKALPPLEYLSSDGFKILAGRNNLQNDRLSLKQAAKNDIWLHIKGGAGAHVILESKNGEFSERSLLEAAVIAALNSSERKAEKVQVDYTRAKNVRKPAGMKPGKVLYYEYKSLNVRPDPKLAEKLKRLP